jgi:8-oxo-dGTP diphosphatase
MSTAGPVDALAWIVVRDGRLLHVRSRDNDVFYLPGGKREPGESDVAALCREVREELTVELDPATLTLVTVVTAAAHGYPFGRQVRMTCYAADPAAGSPDPRPTAEVTELRWLSMAERPLAAPAGQVVIDRVLGAGVPPVGFEPTPGPF